MQCGTTFFLRTRGTQGSSTMTSSQERSFFSEIRNGQPIQRHKLAYLHARASSKWYEYIVGKFQTAAKEENLTQAQLARRIGKTPEVVNRLLGSPGNWTLETISSLLAGICGEELEPQSLPLLGRTPRNMSPTGLIELKKGANENTGSRSKSEPVQIDWQHA
jgi:hypothetical protein